MTCQRQEIATERVGFEPTEPCGSSDFKSDAFDHSATSPEGYFCYITPGEQTHTLFAEEGRG